jgi:hypothetical protein
MVARGTTGEAAMREGQNYAVWLNEEAAHAFLGIDTKQPQSRWVVLGECTGEEAGVGFWLNVDRIEQWTAMGNDKSIKVTPPGCLIPWSYVITVQAMGELKELKVTGFKS